MYLFQYVNERYLESKLSKISVLLDAIALKLTSQNIA